VIGKDSHTPVISNKNAMGIIIKNPLKNAIICAGSGFSVDAKYSFNPLTAICGNYIFRLLLNILTIILAENKKIK
jgi:hypothetical protein